MRKPTTFLFVISILVVCGNPTSLGESACGTNEAKEVPILWKHSNFSGECFKVRGDVAGFKNFDFNDKASSVIVPSGMSLVLFEHTNFKGRKWVITGPTCVENFGDWHDKASSVMLSEADTSGTPSCLR